jgi:hypothetical protein
MSLRIAVTFAAERLKLRQSEQPPKSHFITRSSDLIE